MVPHENPEYDSAYVGARPLEVRQEIDSLLKYVDQVGEHRRE